MTQNPLLEGLDENQRQAVEAVRGRVSIIATAGSGKTRVITNRIAYAIETKAQEPETGLALTFTNKAASEIRGRIARLKIPPVAAATFHATALRQLAHFWPQVIGGKMWSVISFFLMVSILLIFMQEQHQVPNFHFIIIPIAMIIASFFIYTEKKFISSIVHWMLVALSFVIGYYSL